MNVSHSFLNPLVRHIAHPSNAMHSERPWIPGGILTGEEWVSISTRSFYSIILGIQSVIFPIQSVWVSNRETGIEIKRMGFSFAILFPSGLMSFIFLIPRAWTRLHAHKLPPVPAKLAPAAIKLRKENVRRTFFSSSSRTLEWIGWVPIEKHDRIVSLWAHLATEGLGPSSLSLSVWAQELFGEMKKKE